MTFHQSQSRVPFNLPFSSRHQSAPIKSLHGERPIHSCCSLLQGRYCKEVTRPEPARAPRRYPETRKASQETRQPARSRLSRIILKRHFTTFTASRASYGSGIQTNGSTTARAGSISRTSKKEAGSQTDLSGDPLP